MKAVDYSAPSTGNTPVPVATFRKIRALFPHDMLLNIPGAWHGGSRHTAARQSIVNAREAGFTHHATYTVVNSLPGKFAVEWAQQVIGNEWDNLSFIGIDVELPTTPAIVLEACITARQMGVRPVIYSAKWAWQQYMAGNIAFADYPLWNAFYDNDPDVDFARHPYGGWAIDRLAGEQYTNTTHVDGFGFDFNYFDDNFVRNVNAVPEVPPLIALVDAWKRDMAAIAVDAADLIHTPMNVLRLALHSIYTSRRAEDWKALVGA